MSNDQHLAVDPVRLAGAAHRLDELADRLSNALRANETGLGVTPGGADEVSHAAARTFDGVGASLATEVESGAHELRKLAAVLRLQATGYTKSEIGNETLFRA